MNTLVKSDISLDNSPLDVQNGFHRLGSVWEVIETHAWPIVNFTCALSFLQASLQERLNRVQQVIDLNAADIRPEDRENFQIILNSATPWLKRHDLTASLDRLNRLRDEYEHPDASASTIISEINVFNETLEDELRRKIFLYVVPEDENLYRNPIASFSLTWGTYPSAREDVREACRCYALGRYTACVFHCMAILQCGLYALASDVGVALRYPVQLAEWSEVIHEIEKKIAPLSNHPRSAARDERMTFLSACVVQFRYFKDAWRNHVAHMRESYDRDQAHSILLHVRDFMETLSTSVAEAQ